MQNGSYAKMKIVFGLLIIIITVYESNEYGNYDPLRRPKVMDDRIPLEKLLPQTKIIQKRIVLYHNFFRSKVIPTAANMLRMRWHQGAAKTAQRWADQCVLLTHDNFTDRFIQNYGFCGQNIFIATHKVPWFFAIQTWWLEKKFFKYGKPNNLTLVGHYTQMVWGPTHEIGCGIAECLYHRNSTSQRDTTYYNYVCNYCPVGNIPGRIQRPYKKGRSCGQCRNRCHHKLCLNPCLHADYWSNCRQLYKTYPNWLCHERNTKQGRDRYSKCRATCTCKNKIFN